MSDLDKVLFKLVRKWVDQDAIAVMLVKGIKQAFVDSGYIPSYADVINQSQKMTGQEWYDRFIDEFLEDFDDKKYITPNGSVITSEFEKDVKKWFYRKVAGLE